MSLGPLQKERVCIHGQEYPARTHPRRPPWCRHGSLGRCRLRAPASTCPLSPAPPRGALRFCGQRGCGVWHTFQKVLSQRLGIGALVSYMCCARTGVEGSVTDFHLAMLRVACPCLQMRPRSTRRGMGMTLRRRRPRRSRTRCCFSSSCF